MYAAEQPAGRIARLLFGRSLVDDLKRRHAGVWRKCDAVRGSWRKHVDNRAKLYASAGTDLKVVCVEFQKG